MPKKQRTVPAKKSTPGSAWKAFPLDPAFFAGAVSVIHDDVGLQPCRLPHQKKHLFPSPNDSLWQKALSCSGVRLRMETDATALKLQFLPLVATSNDIPLGHAFDAVINNRIVQVAYGDGGATEVVLDKIGKGLRTLEIWLPPSNPVKVTALLAKGAKTVRPLPDRRPMWVTWGSSLTHCVRAGSAARTWPAAVARKHDLNLVSLGFGGDCHLDPLVAMVIRDLPASYISMKLGINAVGRTLAARTYAPLVTAAVAIIREKHPATPIALISPMASPPRESTPSATGYTLEGMRSDMQSVYQALTAAGDMNLYYVSGMDFFNCKDIDRYANDQVHPNAAGIDLQAERFSNLVMPLLLGR